MAIGSSGVQADEAVEAGAKTRLKISVVIPTYNRSSLLPRALNSVLAQTRPPEEIIVVDDGGRDNTREVVSRFPGVRYVYQQNKGLSGARNTGIREARCDWIAFLDDDDEWMPEKLAEQERLLLQNPKAMLCYTGIVFLVSDGTEQVKRMTAPEALWPALRLEAQIPFSSVLARKDALNQVGGFDERLRSAEDWDISARLAARFPFVLVTPPLVRFYFTNTSLSTITEKMLAAELAILDSLLIGLHGLSRLLWKRRVLSRIYYRAAVSARTEGRSGFNYLFRSFRYWPLPTFLPVRYKTLAVSIADRIKRLPNRK